MFTIGIVLITLITIVVGLLGLFVEAPKVGPELKTREYIKVVAKRYHISNVHAVWVIEEQNRLGCRGTDIRLQNLARAIRKLEANH